MVLDFLKKTQKYLIDHTMQGPNSYPKAQLNLTDVWICLDLHILQMQITYLLGPQIVNLISATI